MRSHLLFNSRFLKVSLGVLLVFILLFFSYYLHFLEEKAAMHTNPFGEQVSETRKKGIDCSDLNGGNIAVLLAIGTSNAANVGSWRFEPESNVYSYNHNTGKCYVASDPLLGGGGNGGSVWTRLGYKLVRYKNFEKVLIAPMGMAYSTLNRRISDVLFERIAATKSKLNESGIKITHLVFAQGEWDGGVHNHPVTPSETYIKNSKIMIADMRKMGISAPMYFSISTYCNGFESEEVREAQRSLAQIPTIFLGAATDPLRGRWNRWDNCHFSGLGLERVSQRWYTAITGKTPSFNFFIDQIKPWKNTLLAIIGVLNVFDECIRAFIAGEFKKSAELAVVAIKKIKNKIIEKFF